MTPVSKNNIFSIVVPVYNSAASLFDLFKDIKITFEKLEETFEVIFVDDCSNDNSWDKLCKINKEHTNTTIIKLKNNCGQNSATLCGIHHAQGDIVITIDDDLQYPPIEIEKLISAHKSSNRKIIFGDPIKRMHGRFHRVMAAIGKLYLHQFALPQYSQVNFFTTFRLLDRHLFFNEGKPVNSHLFFIWNFPANQCMHIQVEHKERYQGNSGYTAGKLTSHYKPFLLYSGIKLTKIVAIGLIIGIGIIILKSLIKYNFQIVNNIQYLVSETWIIFSLLLVAIVSIIVQQNHLNKMKILNYRIDKKVLNGNS